MPFISIPEMGDLNMAYVVNPLPHQATADFSDSQPLDPSKHALLMLAAGTFSMASFTMQMSDARLASQFNLVFIDDFFSGKTTAAERESHTYQESADAFLRVLDELQVGAVSIFGEGISSANITVYMALKRPELVKSFVLASPGWQVETEANRQSLSDVLALVAESKEEGKSGQVSDDILEAYVGYYLGNALRLRTRLEDCKAMFEKRYGAGHSIHDLKQIILTNSNREAIPGLDTITVPVLIISGTDDKAVSPIGAANQWAKALSAAKGGATVTTITGAPHLMSYTDYSVLNRLVSRFVARSLEA